MRDLGPARVDQDAGGDGAATPVDPCGQGTGLAAVAVGGGGQAAVARSRRAGRGHATDVGLALHWLDFLLGWPGGFLELRAIHQDGERESIWPRAAIGELAHYVGLIEQLHGEVECSMLRPRRGWGTSSPAIPVLWARLDGGKRQANVLRRFRPVPTFVVREGSSTRYVALWALQEPVKGWEEIVRWNKRLAHAIGTAKKHADPDGFFVPLPGTVLRAGRGRPVPVLAARVGIETYTVQQVVGRLRDAPDPDAWRDAPGDTSGARW